MRPERSRRPSPDGAEGIRQTEPGLTPLDGVITKVSPAIVANPGLVTEDPMEDGWFFKMTLAHATDLEELMDEDAYRKFIE